MTETRYMKQYKVVSGPSGESIERIYVKKAKQEEIRFSWWPNGKFVPRALDVTEEELFPLLNNAIQQGIFSNDFLDKLRSVLCTNVNTTTEQHTDRIDR